VADMKETFLGVGYTRDRAGLPLEAVRVPVPRPAADEVLIRVAASSLNPLEYKLADLNFMGRTPPVVLGFDLAGLVAGVGRDVEGVAVGDEVAAMAGLNGDGGWAATGGDGGSYAVAPRFLTVRGMNRVHSDRQLGRGVGEQIAQSSAFGLRNWVLCELVKERAMNRRTASELGRAGHACMEHILTL
jgi:hypothetical protein